MASSSSSHQKISEFGPFSEFERKKFPVPRKLYDAFINHRGPDVKETVAAALHKYLKEKDCLAFLDDREFELGDPLIPTIANAIYTSRVQIAIFSPRYAESSWCLDELLLMLKTEARFIPVFCDVKPDDLRYLYKGIYAQAFQKHEENGRYSEERLHQWKEALRTSSGMSGHIFSTANGDVEMLCTKIAMAVQKEVENTRYLEVAKHPVGLDELVEDFERQVKGKGNIVGIFAMGGSGKTTLAKEFCNRKKSEYDGLSFVFDVREASAKDELPCLQSQLLKDLFNEDRKFRSVAEGTPFLRDRMGRTRNSFLIVLDDVEDQKQLDALLFRNNVSLVIVTSRDEKVLSNARIGIRYKLKEMDRAHGKELFCWKAFGLPKAPQGYETLVDSFVNLCGGLPLSIEVSAGNLSGTDDVAIWQSELTKFRSTLHLDIKARLKISFDRLDREQKQIFLDIACFFIGQCKSIGIRIWKGSGWNAEHTIQTLKDKCLLEIERSPRVVHRFDDPFIFKMHDHLRDLGREMAIEMTNQDSFPLRLWRPRELKSLEMEGLKSILSKTIGKKFRCFNSIFDSSLGYKITYFLGNSDDGDRILTDLLWIEIESNRNKFESIPSWIPLQSLQCLRIFGGNFWRLWKGDGQVPYQLKELLLRQTPFSEFPKELGMLNNLEDLVLQTWWDGMPVDATSLLESLGNLNNLRRLVLGCRLKGELTLSSSGYPKSEYSGDRCMHKLQSLVISELTFSSKVIVSGEYCPRLEELLIHYAPDLNEVHLWLVKSLKSLKLSKCRQLKSISGNLDVGQLLEWSIHDCPQLDVSDSFQVKHYYKLPVNGIEDLEYLHFTNGHHRYANWNWNWKCKTLQRTVSNGGIRRCIQILKRISEIFFLFHSLLSTYVCIFFQNRVCRQRRLL
ncbi:disease resistance protein L6 isoform X2 [Cryptomeria japonica]|uniref:disease resistance protein L6 isoform X2 n=1 Tax=Cryptomeria japonica TaxID=3369 RepID=UPI0025AC5CC2|nr:disease resistance protein L6 isoform X2 [Cryptomeria japonica]